MYFELLRNPTGWGFHPQTPGSICAKMKRAGR